MIDKERDRFVNFDPVKTRVDILMHETMAGKDMYSKLWNVVTGCPLVMESRGI